MDEKVIELLKKRISNLTLLLEINKKIVQTLDYKALLKVILELATKVVNAEASSLMLIDEKTNELVFDIAIGEKGNEIKTIRLKIGEGIAGVCAQKGESILVEDVNADSRWSKKADEKSKFVTKSILCVPLKLKEKTIGIVEVLNQKDRIYFNNEDKNILEIFASQVAIAISNAKLIYDLNIEKEKLYALFIGMSEGAILLNQNFEILTINKTAMHYFDLNENCINNLFFDLIKEKFNTNPGISKFFSMNDEIINIEMSRISGKSLYLMAKLTKLIDENKTVKNYIMIIRDQTKEKKEELLKRNFLSLISHKLKTPLTVISGFNQILLEEIKNGNYSDLFKKSVETINERTIFLISLVQKLLSFKLITTSGVELERKQTKILDLINKSIEKMRGLIDSKIALIEIDPEIHNLPSLYLDEEKMLEVFSGLIENAIKFNNKNEKKVKIHSDILSNYIQINITDNGEGIPSEEKDNLYQKFYQIEEDFTGQVEGTGLGLVLIKNIIELHQGKIDFTSKVGQGTTFYFTLPYEH